MDNSCQIDELARRRRLLGSRCGGGVPSLRRRFTAWTYLALGRDVRNRVHWVRYHRFTVQAGFLTACSKGHHILEATCH